MKFSSKILLSASAAICLLSASVVAMEAKPDKDAAGIPAKKVSTAGGAEEASLKVETESAAKTSISSSTTGAGAGAGAQAEEQLYLSALEKRLAKLFFKITKKSLLIGKNFMRQAMRVSLDFCCSNIADLWQEPQGGEEL